MNHVRVELLLVNGGVGWYIELAMTSPRFPTCRIEDGEIRNECPLPQVSPRIDLIKDDTPFPILLSDIARLARPLITGSTDVGPARKPYEASACVHN